MVITLLLSTFLHFIGDCFRVFALLWQIKKSSPYRVKPCTWTIVFMLRALWKGYIMLCGLNGLYAFYLSIGSIHFTIIKTQDDISPPISLVLKSHLRLMLWRWVTFWGTTNIQASITYSVLVSWNMYGSFNHRMLCIFTTIIQLSI